MRIQADFMFNTEYPPDFPLDADDPFAGVTDFDAVWMRSEFFEDIGMYVSRFENLRPNTRHYFRARTELTITRRGELGEGIYRSYSYRVQISESPDFIDFLEIIIPGMDPPDGTTAGYGISWLRAYSPWTQTVAFTSGRSDDDFDGDVNVDMFPLPDQDFEVTFDEETRTLRYRFRSDQIGADGLRDQQVDQRFISRLVANRTFDFRIDMTYHRDHLIGRRVVEIPYSIYAAFNERQINLHLTSNGMTLTLPYGALEITEIVELPDFGRGSTVELIIESDPDGTPFLAHTQGYSVQPQAIAVTVTSPTRTVPVTSFAREVGVGLVLNDPMDRLLYNVNPFWNHEDIYGWQPLNSTFNDVSGLFSTSAWRVGTFALITTQAPLTEAELTGEMLPAEEFNEALFIVNTALIISDMFIFEPDTLIEANQFNNILFAFMMGRQSVEMNRSMTRAEHQSMGRAGLLATGTTVRNDTGIAIFARLYELRTRSVIRGFSTTAVADIDQAQAQHREGILKAAHVGLIEGNQARPQAYLTFGEFMNMLAILIEDAG